MPYLQELIATQNEYVRQQQINSTVQMGLRPGEAYAQYFPSYEVTAPQYQQPIPWTLSNLGYRTNEVAYACIALKMKTISEPSLEIYDKELDEVVDNDEFYQFMEQPCPDVSETDFHSANQMYLDIAGVIGWEKDFANNGSLINIWPMMPQYCSFMRGEGRLLRAIRYQPYTGLPGVDIDRDKIVLMMYADPLYFGLKPLSPTTVLADVIKIDNNMTTMVSQFLQNGAFVSGLLKSDQVINEKDAEFAKQRFHDVHGGYNHAGDIVVVGKGLEYQQMGQTFREMVFPEVDARSETRICMGYSVPPILVSAKSGMDRSTYSNYEQARRAWYEEYVTSQWKFLAERYTKDILPHFSVNPNHVLRFDISEVKALQEDRDAAWTRAREAYKGRIINRNDALVEMGLDMLENELLGTEYYQTAMTQQSLSLEDNLDIANATQDVAQAKEELDVRGQELVKVETTKEDEDDEEKKFRAFAKRRLKENKPNDIGEYEFKHLSEHRQRVLKSEFGIPDPDAMIVIEALRETIKAISFTQPTYQPNNISITANIEPNKPPDVHVENKIPEQKAMKAPVVNVEVNPTPINVENKIEVKPADVKLPKVKREIQEVKRDGGNNIEGTITEMEYDE